MVDKIMTQHPDQGKAGVNIDKLKYADVRETILDVIQSRGTITFKGLVDEVSARLGRTFDGSVPWYVTTIKLDLEAKGVIERIPNKKPQELRMAEK
jgi:hypothetical protein